MAEDERLDGPCWVTSRTPARCPRSGLGHNAKSTKRDNRARKMVSIDIPMELDQQQRRRCRPSLCAEQSGSLPVNDPSQVFTLCPSEDVRDFLEYWRGALGGPRPWSLSDHAGP